MNPLSDDLRRQILLEIALSISGELDLRVLLGNCLPIFLRKLNCVSAGVLQSDDQGLRPVMILPLAQQRSREWMSSAQELAAGLDPAGEGRLTALSGGTVMLGFSLPGFGLLVLGRRAEFDEVFIKEFEPLIRMLTRACLACIEVERRRDAERRLAQVQATQEALLDNLPFLAWMKDRSGRYVAVNRAFAAYLGRTPGDVVGRTADEVWPEAKAREFAAGDAEVLRTGRHLTGLDQEKGPEGAVRWFEFSKRSIQGEDGEILGTTGFRWEVTDRIRAEQSLAYRTAFQKVVMDLAIGFVNTPLEKLDQGVANALAMIGGFAFVDRAYLFRYDFTAATMSNTHEWCAPGIAPEKDNLQDVPNSLFPDWVGAHVRGDLVHVPCVAALDGEDALRRILEPQGIKTLITLPLFHDGHCFGFVGFDAVQSEKKWSEEEIALLKVMAVLLTNAEIRRLHEEHLIEAKAAAEAASLAKSEFLANMSHEIRTPLHGTVGMIDLLKSTRLSREQREFLDMAESSAESLLNVINDILDFSKIEAGKLELASRFFDLEDEVYRLASLVSARAREKDLELLVRFDPAAPRRVEADNLRLRQVLSNLLFNAVKFTNVGHILLNVQCVDVEEGRVRLRFSVEDTGIGIPEDKLAIIFDQFSQVDGSASRRYGGTGLGLAICQQLVRLMGGHIAVRSRLDEGSTFYFELDLPWVRVEDSEPETLFTLRGYRALVVDDVAINRRILSEYLTAWGVEHECVNGSLGALRVLNQAAENMRPYDFMLLDHAMPGMDGLELAKTLQANTRLPSPRIILMTSMWGLLSTEQCTDLDIWASLPKPVAASDLFNAIRDCLLGQRGVGCTMAEDEAHEEETGAQPDHARRHVLVVDDHPINRKTAGLVLEKLGYRVSTAENGLEALDMLRVENFAMVFLDVQMPVMDGYETSRTIRAMGGRFSDLPIIALTANAMESDRERCLAAGMTDYLPKPLPKDRLLAILKEQEAPVQTVQKPVEPVRDFHHQEFLARYDLEVDVAAEILRDFLADGLEGLLAVQDAVQQRNEQTEALAHRFKGPCSYVGANRLRDLCAAIMAEAVAGRWEQADALSRELDPAWEDFAREARAWLNDQGADAPETTGE